MANRLWLDEVQRQLIQKGLPPSYIRRFMDELADHLEDLKEETMNKDKIKNQNCLSQLGSPDTIADAATTAYRQRTFFGRHPVLKFLVFGISPFFSMLLAFCFMVFCMALLCWLCENYCAEPVENYIRSLKNPADFGNWIMSIVTITLPAALLTFLYCRWADRSNLGKKWMLLSCLVISILPALMFHFFTVSNIPGKNCYTINFSFPPTIPQQWIQLLAPLAVGLWFLRQTRKKPDTDETKSLRAAA